MKEYGVRLYSQRKFDQLRNKIKKTKHATWHENVKKGKNDMQLEKVENKWSTKIIKIKERWGVVEKNEKNKTDVV